MSRVKDGKLENLFEKPQPAAPTSKTATLDKLADRFCAGLQTLKEKPATEAQLSQECEGALVEVQSIEAQVQTDIDTDNLKCKRVPKYLKQLDDLNMSIKKNSCPIADLGAYIKSIKALKCKK